jgi:hypothetical protein
MNTFSLSNNYYKIYVMRETRVISFKKNNDGFVVVLRVVGLVDVQVPVLEL